MLLENLPTDVLCLILEVTEPGDFLAFVSASPTCFRVYQARPRQTFVNVLTNAIAPGALHHAFAVAHHACILRRCKPDCVDKSDITRWRSEQSPDNSPDSGFWSDLRALIGMLRMHAVVTRFVDNFVEEAAQAIFELGDHVLPTDSEPQLVEPSWSTRLSLAERTRFERAFYRYELYCRLYPIGKSRDTPTTGQIGTFPGSLANYEPAGIKLRPYEYSEIVCVHYHLARIVTRTYRDLTAPLVAAIRGARGVHIPHVQGPWFREEGMGFLDLANTSGMLLYHEYLSSRSGANRQGHIGRYFVSHFVSCDSALKGLDFMSRFMSADLGQRKDMLGVDFMQRNFISEAESWRQSHPFEHLPSENVISGTSQDLDELGTAGFRAFGKDFYEQESSDVCEPMAEMALPMWDAQRFQSDWAQRVFEENTDRQASEERRNAICGPDEAARLKGVQLPSTELRRIWREFRTSDWDSSRYSDCVLWSRADD